MRPPSRAEARRGVGGLRGAATLAAILLGAAILLAGPARAVDQDTPAEAAILVDVTAGAVLFEKNADRPLPPASMSKLMTLFVVFEALEEGRIALSDEFRTSAKAASMGGSKMFIREGEVVSVENLIRGVVVQSGNDAAVALAEALAGTEEAFADYLTQRGREIGLKNSTFTNATGWPDPEHLMSVRDRAILAERVIREFPQYYGYFSEESFTWDGITQRNRNPLLGLGLGVDGLKTGHTEAAGYGLISSAKRGDRRVVLVLAGLESVAQRRQEAERLVNWAFRAFETRALYGAGETVATARTWIGAEEAVGLAPARDVILTAPFGMSDRAEITAEFVEPVEAPIAAGTELGQLRIAVPEMPEVTVPLVAAEDVARGGFGARIGAAAELLLGRVLPGREG